MLAHGYDWHGQRQNDAFDRLTSFVYRVPTFEGVLAQAQVRLSLLPNYPTLRSYALNRWYNFWSARAVEAMFCASRRVVPAVNHCDRLMDFAIDGVQFDHKTSVFPQGFRRPLDYARHHPRRFITWLYTNQSQGGRKHMGNRLFVVLHARNGEHWRLRADLTWLESQVHDYLRTFDARRLHQFQFAPGSPTLADVIWAVQ